MPDYAAGVAVSGPYVYVANRGAGLRILDVSEPAQPKQVGLYDSPYLASAVVVAGDYAYVTDFDSLRVVNVSDPAHPTEAGFWTPPDGRVLDIGLSGNHVFVSVESSVRCIDISDLAHPTEVGIYNASGFIAGLAVEANRAYVCAWQQGWYGLRIVDISNPRGPADLGNYYEYCDNISAMAIPGDRAYVTDSQGLRILDVSDPAHMTNMSTLYAPGAACSVALTRNYTYVGTTGRGLRIVDTSTLRTPTEVASFIGEGEDRSNSEYDEVVVQKDVAFVNTGGGPVRILSVADPTHPAALDTIWGEGATRDLAVTDRYAYLATDAFGLRVVDVSDPANCKRMGSCAMPDDPGGVAVAGDYAYVADAESGLRIVNVSDPMHPTEVGACDTPGRAADVAVAGAFAYVADSGSGLRVIDVSDPVHPVEVAYVATPYNDRVRIEGGYAFVGTYDGLRVISINDPIHPQEVAFYEGAGHVRDMAVSGEYAYVAADDVGLMILRLLRDKVTASIAVTGGNLVSTSGDTAFAFPEGAFTSTVAVTYRHLWTDRDTGARAGIGYTFDLSAVYSDTGQVAQLTPGQCFTTTVHYTDAEKGPAIESTLALYTWGGSQWVKEPSSALDAAAHTVTAVPNHLGLFAVLGETNRVFLPVIRGR
jgi:hypothetical protein